MTAEICFLSDGRARGMGAMFRRDLGDQVLVFSYPKPAVRLFHTFFCPELRILALEEDGTPLTDAVIPANRLKRLPATRIVVECSPSLPLTRADLIAIADSVPGQPVPPEKGM